MVDAGACLSIDRWRNPPAGGQVVYAQNMYTVYVLRSTSKIFRYVGMTNDIKRRLSEHQNGKSKTTSRFLPVELIYSEIFDTRIQARNREKYLKSGVGREFLNSLKI